MSIKIHNNIIQNTQNYSQKISEKYKENSAIQKHCNSKNNPSNKINQLRNTRPQELSSFLNNSEIRVLDEVFGSTNRNNSLPKYNGSNNVSLLKGSKIDIEL
ncbi:MAG: hypothetical protein U9N34_04785 [Candidatus Cloacimonadota bacterium]|nr:hypothetical protein [Candidatus Cloacimonadota bacterium]